MWEIVTGSRLHFGLFQPGLAPAGQRQFGGAGMMIQSPGLRLRAEQAKEWSASGPLARRVLEFAYHYQTHNQAEPLRFLVESAAPEHAGLGTGTQLGLAVVKLITTALGRPDLPLEVLTASAGRGRRSGIGAHGFAQGGLLIDAGKRQGEDAYPLLTPLLAPLAARQDVPPEWRIVLAIPEGDGRWHGRREQQAFDQLGTLPADPELAEYLYRLAMQELLPALQQRDLESFGESLYELNVKAGGLFAAAQGGLYAGPQVAALVAALRDMGVRGTGQSSWGPTVFGMVAEEEHAAFVVQKLRERFPLEQNLFIAAPLNEGAHVVELREAS